MDCRDVNLRGYGSLPSAFFECKLDETNTLPMLKPGWHCHSDSDVGTGFLSRIVKKGKKKNMVFKCMDAIM